jgi:hypothetical protein
MNKLLQKINSIRDEVVVSKDAKNAHKNYDYFSPDSINKSLQPLLSKYNLFDMFHLTWNNDKQMYEAIYTIRDVEEDTKVSFNFDIKTADIAGANGAQESGGTMTYAKRYSQMNAFNIADNSLDLDNDRFNKGMKSKPKPQPVKATVQPIKEAITEDAPASDPQLRLIEKLQKEGKIPTDIVFADKTKTGQFENIKLSKNEASTVISEANAGKPISWGGSEDELPF